MDRVRVRVGHTVLGPSLCSAYSHRLVRLEEFYDAAWSRDRAPNISKISKFSNNLSHALVVHILKPSKPKSRMVIWTKLVTLGKVFYLSQSHGFNLCLT